MPASTLSALGGKADGFGRALLMVFDGQSLSEQPVENWEALSPHIQAQGTVWVDVEGLTDSPMLESLGRVFSIRPQVLAEVLDTQSPPRLEELSSYMFIAVRLLVPAEGAVATEQIALILGSNFVLTFRQGPADPFGSVREKLRQGRFRIRSSGPDHLAYALLDAIVDAYFPVLSGIEKVIESLERQASKNPTHETLERIQELKREIVKLSQVAWSMSELLTHLARVGRHSVISKMTCVYIRDVRDHARRIEEILRSYRELTEGLHEIYVSNLNMRTNEVMKVLTVISTIFLPLNFVASFFGMNFRGLEGLDWSPGVLAVLLCLLAVGMIVLFRRKRWL